MKPVPLLARIRVATPCRADWTQMTGDERVRHCAQCKKDVFNLSDMTREQAERLIIEKNGDLCARYYQRQDGTILLADCSVGLAQKKKTKVVAAGALALLAGTPVAAFSLRSKAHAPAEPQVRITDVVEIEVPPPPAPPQPPPAPPPEATEILGGMPPPPEMEQVKPARAAAGKRLGNRPSKASSPVDIDE
jgi:hypothetical protein